jgi:TRAP-type C4-dicarboxylate transport system substrate-binding protein
MMSSFSRRSLIASAAALAAAPAFAATEVAVGAYVIPGSPGARLFTDFAAALKAKSNGALAPNMLIHGEGGSEEQVLTALRRGRIHVASLSTLVLSGTIPEIGVLTIPFLFDSVAELDFVVDSVVIPRIDALAADKGLTALRWLELGPQNIFARKPILAPSDAKNVRIRTTQDIATKLYLEAVQADVIYLPSPDVIPSLQTGLLDGGVTPAIAYAETGLVRDAPHYSLVGFCQVGNLILANKKWLEGLPPDLSAIVGESFADNAAIRALIRGFVAAGLARQKELGFTAYEMNTQQRAAWKAAAAGIDAKVIAELGGASQSLFDAVQAGKRAFTSR